jgi:hypothetical protein
MLAPARLMALMVSMSLMILMALMMVTGPHGPVVGRMQ